MVRKPSPARPGAAARTTHPTARRLLDAAEALFAQQGFESTTVRQIIGAAGVGNGAAVAYYFGSKDELYGAVVRRLQEPVSDQRLRRLAALEADGAVPAVRPLVAAFVEPLLDLHGSAKGAVAARLLAHQVARRDDRSWPVALGAVDEVITRFRSAFARALPGLAPADVDWRFWMMGGVLITYELGLGDLPRDRLGADRLVDYCTAGWES
jgi:AcrR family transcriptional regulator